MLNLHKKVTYIFVPMINRKIGALFDLDGVLIDSESTYTQFWREIDRIYPTGIDDFAIAIKGTTLPEILKYFSEESVQNDILKRIGEFQDKMEYELFPGVEQFLKKLKERGIPMAIVTSSDEKKMQLLFSQHPDFKKYFDVVIDASMITHSKPNPEGYLKAADRLGCRPEDCFVFEDSLQGLKAGKSSGATVIGIASTYPTEMLKGKAAMITDGLKDIDVDDLLAMK